MTTPVAPGDHHDPVGLRDRYGPPRRRAGRTAVLVAVAVGVLGTLWAAWVAFSTERPVTWTDIGYQVVDSGTTRVTFDVTFTGATAPDTVAVCTVRALDRSFGVVGQVDVTMAPAGRRTVRSTVVVPTSQLAVTGLVRDCAVQP